MQEDELIKVMGAYLRGGARTGTRKKDLVSLHELSEFEFLW
jgi:hypothetical protein